MAVPSWAYTGALCAGAPRAGWLAGDIFKASTKSLRYPRSIIKINLYTQLSVPWERGDGVWVVGRGYCYKPISFFFPVIFFLPIHRASSHIPLTFSLP